MSLYSDLNEVLTPYAQKIKDKADKSTTYTKTEVDDLISGVDVETDTTLIVPGAPADAAETGRLIGLLKADLDAQGNDIVQLDNGKASLYPDVTSWYRGYFKNTGEFISNTTNAAPTNTPFVVNAGHTLDIYPNGLSVSLRQFTKSGDTYTQVSIKIYTEDTSVFFGADTYISIHVTKTSGAILTLDEVTTKLWITSNIQHQIYKTVDNVDLTKRNLFGEKINIPYELGSVTYKNNEAWVYGNVNNMVRTPQNRLVHLYKGTTVGLTDYIDARFYIGWFRPDGTSTFSPGWKTSDYLVTEEGYYSLLVSNLTPVAQSSAEALGSLISIKAMDIVSDVFDSKSQNSRSHNNELDINPYILNSKFIAHRGCDTQYAPENTIPGFKWAIDSGYKILEYDIRFTSDGVPVLIHDETINRTARNQDGSEISTDIYVANSSYEELLNYDFGIWRGSSFAGTKIPTLEEFLVFIKKYGCCGDTDWTTLGSNITSSQIATFMSTVKKTGMMGSVMITSNISVIRNLLLEYPNIMVCVANQGNPLSTLDDCAVAMASARLSIVSLQYPYAEKSWHEYAHNLGLYTKSFTLSINERIKASLEFSPDLMIVGSLKRDEIVID